MSGTTPLAVGVGDRVRASLAERGITELFPIQAEVVPGAIEGRDVLAQSPTGSGKTLAFAITMVERLAEPRPFVQALVLVPTRELAVQVVGEIASISGRHGLDVAAIYGGAGIGPQAKAAKRADILVATPGRLQDLVDQRMVDLSKVSILVLDEADRMLDMGFEPQVVRLLREVPTKRQTLLFSATLEGAVGRIAERYTKDPLTVVVAPTLERSGAIEHRFQQVVHEEKLERLLEVLDDAPGIVVVFVRTKRGADRIAKKLRARGERAGAIHGGMTQPGRLRELARFDSGEIQTLVATDVFARGIDLEGISMVVNFDPPEDADAYTHRTGRTGRAGAKGIAMTFVLDDQRADVQKMADAVGALDQYAAAGIELIRTPNGQQGQTRHARGQKPRNRGSRQARPQRA